MRVTHGCGTKFFDTPRTADISIFLSHIDHWPLAKRTSVVYFMLKSEPRYTQVKNPRFFKFKSRIYIIFKNHVITSDILFCVAKNVVLCNNED